MKKFLFALLLAVSTVSFAKPIYVTLPPQPVVTNTVPLDVTGNWMTGSVPHFTFALSVGNYFVSGVPGTTCGKALRVDASIPIGTVNYHGRVGRVDSTGTGFAFGETYYVFGRNSVVATLRLNSYNAVTNVLNVTVTSTGGPNGTFDMYRDQISPRTVTTNVCP